MAGEVGPMGRDEHAHAVVFVCDIGMANNPDRQYAGEFRAHGPAVIHGLMCGRGSVEGRFDRQLDGYFDFGVTHRFSCLDDVSGLDVTLRVKMYESMHTYFEWEVANGFGHHAGLGGSGSGVGTESRMGRHVVRDHLFGHLKPPG